MNSKIYLIGYRCTGKTTIGKKLAQEMHIPFLDTDEKITQISGLDIATIVAEKGWEYFRRLEKQVLKQTVELDACVISTGGGVILDPDNFQVLRTHGICIWLQARVETIMERLKKDTETASQRPALSGLSLLEETEVNLGKRIPLYEKAKHFAVDTDQFQPNECIEKILRRIKHVRL